MQIKNNRGAFTLVELLIVIGIIGILSAITVLVISPSILDKVRVPTAASDQRQLQGEAVLYRNDVGFYPPDVNRGWDPGFTRPFPWKPDTGDACATPDPTGCPAYSQQACSSGCPSDWINQINQRWQGPYIVNWPQNTPWNGKYDYNNWPGGANRPENCTVPAGIYIGVQGDYSDPAQNTIPASAEQLMLDRGLDSDGCLNGESQMLLKKL